MPSRPPLSVVVAKASTRYLTWGIPEETRTESLLETDVDWEIMYADRGSTHVLTRAIRGVPAAVWARMEDRERTALPAGMVFLILCLAGIGAGLLERTYPIDIRLFVIISAIGGGLVGLTMLRYPRQIPLRKTRIPMLMLSSGFLGAAYSMPAETDWLYDTPYVNTLVGDVLTVVGFSTIGVGCLLVAAASFKRTPRQVILIGGLGIVTGAILFGSGQLHWGVAAVTIDPAVTATSVTIGLGAYSLAHVTPRLRHLVIK